MKTASKKALVFSSFFLTAFLLLALLGMQRATARGAAIATYIGDCVDITADREGMRGTPQEKWDAFASYCAERYQDR